MMDIVDSVNYKCLLRALEELCEVKKKKADDTNLISYPPTFYAHDTNVMCYLC